MNKPILVFDARRAIEMALDLRGKATQGQWHFMNHRDQEMDCDCHSIMGQGNCGSLFTVSSNLGIESVTAGGNDSPSPPEATANAEFVVAASAALAPALAYILRDLSDGFLWHEFDENGNPFIPPDHIIYSTVAPIVEWATGQEWWTE